MFKKIASLLLLLMLVAAPASSSLVTIPYVFVPNTPIYSAQVNSNFSTLAGVINGGIDNTNVGINGFYASQIICSNVTTCTLGGAYGLTIQPNVTTQVPLTLTGVSGQSADLFDVYQTQGGTKALYVDSAGVTHFTGSSGGSYVDLVSAQTVGGQKTFTSPLITGSTTIGYLYLTSNSSRGLEFDGSNYDFISAGNIYAPSGYAFGAGSSSYGPTSATIAGTLASGSQTVTGNVFASGQIKAAAVSSTETYEPPLYANGSAAVASTAHSIIISSVLLNSTPNTGCPTAGGPWTSYYCASVTLSPAFSNTGISATTNTGSVPPTFLCGGAPWTYAATGGFVSNTSGGGISFVVVATTPNVLYITESVQQVMGPIICTGY